MEITEQADGFRKYIPPRDDQRSKELATSDAYRWTKLCCAEPFMVGWMTTWEKLYNEPYKGITVDGQVRTDLYYLADEGQDMGAPAAGMVKAAMELLEMVPIPQRQALNHNVDVPEWRSWANPEIYIFQHGIRLEEVSKEFAVVKSEVVWRW
jgi:hypothetical protein